MAALAPLLLGLPEVCAYARRFLASESSVADPRGMPESFFPAGPRYTQQFLPLQPGFSCLLCHLHHLFVISEVGTGLCSETSISL